MPVPLRFKFAMCHFYLSVFFYKLIAYTLIMWFSISVVATIVAYRKFGTLTTRGIKLVTIAMMVLNNIDLFKDLKYVIFNPHGLLYTIFFSFTIVAPVIITILKTKMLLMEMRYYGEN